MAAFLLPGLLSCTTLQPVADAKQYIQTESPSRIWVRTAQQPHLVVQAPRIYLDSIYGYDARGKQMWLALGDVTQVEARKTSLLRTGLLFAGTGVGIVLLGIVLSGQGNSQPEPLIGQRYPALGR